MFDKLLTRKKISGEDTLTQIVDKKHDTGFIFANIMNDLGNAAEAIMANSKLNQMAYGYARRAVATALYLQGLIGEDVYDHNLSFFKAIQVTTDHSVKFQEQAFSEAIKFLQSYSPVITRLLIKQMVVIAQDFVGPESQLSDTEFIEIVMKAYVT